jgi:hypothetical protein
MTLRTYWCVVTQQRANWRGKVIYDPAIERSSALDIEAGYTVQAAFLNLVRQHGGPDADPGQYLMNVYDAPGGVIRLPDFTAPADAAVNPDSLRGYADEHLIAELGRRLQQR